MILSNLIEQTFCINIVEVVVGHWFRLRFNIDIDIIDGYYLREGLYSLISVLPQFYFPPFTALLY